jgi:hypothetical protein
MTTGLKYYTGKRTQATHIHGKLNAEERLEVQYSGRAHAKHMGSTVLHP